MAYLPGRPRLRLLRNTFLPVPASESLSIFRLLLSLSGGDVRLWISIGRFARWIVFFCVEDGIIVGAGELTRTFFETLNLKEGDS